MHADDGTDHTGRHAAGRYDVARVSRVVRA
jgi:hypothetical protein